MELGRAADNVVVSPLGLQTICSGKPSTGLSKNTFTSSYNIGLSKTGAVPSPWIWVDMAGAVLQISRIWREKEDRSEERIARRGVGRYLDCERTWVNICIDGQGRKDGKHPPCYINGEVFNQIIPHPLVDPLQYSSM